MSLSHLRKLFCTPCFLDLVTALLCNKGLPDLDKAIQCHNFASGDLSRLESSSIQEKQDSEPPAAVWCRVKLAFTIVCF